MLKYFKKISSFFIAAILFCLLFNSCKTLNPSAMFGTDENYNFSDFNEEKKEYVIRPYDKLDVRIYTNDGFQLIDMESSTKLAQTEKVTNPYLVDNSGMVKVPTIGLIKVVGLTIKETEKLLEEKYSQYYQKPFVLVKVTNRRVVVFTSGSNAGRVLNIENEQFTLIEALAQAGGIDDFSKAYKIKLLRGDLSNPNVYLFDISSIEEMQKANMVLQANDIIYVEKRARYASKTLMELSPYIALVNTAILIVVSVIALK